MQHLTTLRIGSQGWIVVGLFQQHQCISFSQALVAPLTRLKPELTVQPLRMAVQVYSGIAPPQALLEQIASRPARPTTQPPYMASNLRPPGSVSGHSPNPLRPSAPQPPSDHVEPSPSDIPDEAPPSYEDAMADDLAPIDGPRRDYHQATTQPLRTDGKGSTGDGRLFPDSEH